MSSPSGRGLRPGGVVRALVRLVFLVVFGFGAGLLFGVLLEEPELLANHLRGQSESVVLAPIVETSGELDADRIAEAIVDDGKPLRRLGSEAGTRPSLPTVAAAPPRRVAKTRGEPKRVRPMRASQMDDAWAIQVGAFSDEDAALRVAAGLIEKGYPTEVLSSVDQGRRWRVRVQPIEGEAKASEMVARLKRVEHLPTWLIRMERSSIR